MVCGPLEEKIGDCKVYSSQLRRFINLENLDKQVKVGRYTVDLCVRGTECNGNAVCGRSDGTWLSYGVLQKAILHVDYLKLHFGGGALCIQNGEFKIVVGYFFYLFTFLSIQKPLELKFG